MERSYDLFTLLELMLNLHGWCSKPDTVVAWFVKFTAGYGLNRKTRISTLRDIYGLHFSFFVYSVRTWNPIDKPYILKLIWYFWYAKIPIVQILSRFIYSFGQGLANDWNAEIKIGRSMFNLKCFTNVNFLTQNQINLQCVDVEVL